MEHAVSGMPFACFNIQGPYFVIMAVLESLFFRYKINQVVAPVNGCYIAQ